MPDRYNPLTCSQELTIRLVNYLALQYFSIYLAESEHRAPLGWGQSSQYTCKKVVCHDGLFAPSRGVPVGGDGGLEALFIYMYGATSTDTFHMALPRPKLASCGNQRTHSATACNAPFKPCESPYGR